MNQKLLATYVVVGLVLLTALGSAWAMLVFAAFGLGWLFLAGNPRETPKSTILVSAMVACAVAIAVGCL